MICGIEFNYAYVRTKGRSATAVDLLLTYSSVEEVCNAIEDGEISNKSVQNINWASFFAAPLSTRKALHFVVQSPLAELLYPELL
jgi:hypothetical protein